MLLSVLAALLVAFCAILQLGPLSSWVAELVGRSSYGIYILHPFMVGPAKMAATSVGLGAIGTVALTLAGSMLLALALERWYEQPIRRYFRRRATDY